MNEFGAFEGFLNTEAFIRLSRELLWADESLKTEVLHKDLQRFF